MSERLSYLKTFRYAHNRKRKRLKSWTLVGKMNTSCNIRNRTTFRRTTVVLQRDLPAAAAAAAAKAYSNSKLQKQQAAEITNSRSAVYLVRCSAPAGISTLIFSLSSSFATKQYNNK